MLTNGSRPRGGFALGPRVGALLVGWTLAVGGCAGSDAESAPAAAAPDPAPPPLFPEVRFPQGEGPMSIEAAERVIASVEAGFPPPPDDPARHPRTLEDIQAILARDQVTLFPGAVDRLARLPGVEARALEAQIELAWGESYSLVMTILLEVATYLEGRAVHMESSYRITPEQRRELKRLRGITDQASALAEAFNAVSIKHASRGSELARSVIESAPDSYLGYRLAADYYRTIRRWDAFDDMIAKVAELRPDSNGLVFLRGAAAFGRDQDREAAAELFDTALRNDPNFVRAQVHRIAIAPDVPAIAAELAVLRRMNPQHQVVLWLGPLIDFAASLHP